MAGLATAHYRQQGATKAKWDWGKLISDLNWATQICFSFVRQPILQKQNHLPASIRYSWKCCIVFHRVTGTTVYVWIKGTFALLHLDINAFKWEKNVKYPGTVLLIKAKYEEFKYNVDHESQWPHFYSLILYLKPFWHYLILRKQVICYFYSTLKNGGSLGFLSVFFSRQISCCCLQILPSSRVWGFRNSFSRIHLWQTWKIRNIDLLFLLIVVQVRRWTGILSE